MCWFRALALLLLLAGSAAAQSNPGFVDGLALGANVVPAGQPMSLNTAFTTKADVTSPTFLGTVTINGTGVGGALQINNSTNSELVAQGKSNSASNYSYQRIVNTGTNDAVDYGVNPAGGIFIRAGTNVAGGQTALSITHNGGSSALLTVMGGANPLLVLPGNISIPSGVTVLQTGSAGSPAYNFQVGGNAINSGMYVTSGGAPHNVGVAVDGVNMVTFGPNPGVTCTAGTVNATTMTVANGIVTHC